MKTQTTLVAGGMCCLLLAGFANPVFGGEKKRQKYGDEWPDVNLSAYSRLFIEDFEVSDPKAHKRKKATQVQTVGTRMADMVAEMLEQNGTFEQVVRGKTDSKAPDMLILRVEITQYKPGSVGTRIVMAGAAGSAHLDFVFRLVAAESGELLFRFPAAQTSSWGDIYGENKGIDDMEHDAAREIVMYLERNAGREGRASTKSVVERDNALDDLDEEPGSIGGTADAVAGHRPYSRRFVGSRGAPHWYVTKVTAPETYKAKQVAWLSCEGGSAVSHVNQIPLLDRKDLITTCRPPSWIALTPGIQHSLRIGGQEYSVTFRANQAYKSSIVEALGGWSSFEVLLEEGRAAFASKKKRWQLYPGDLRPRSETAFVACNDYSEVLMVDDSVLFDAKNRQRGCGDYWALTLEPGPHTLKLPHGDLRGDFEAGRYYGVWVDTRCLEQRPGYVDTGEIADIVSSGYSAGTAAVLVLGELFKAKPTCASYKVTGISVRDPLGKEVVASLVVADDPEIENE